jgi:hypothetical protein
VAVLALALGFAATGRAADAPTHVVPGVATDPAIDPGRRDNLIWLTPDTSRRVGKLLLFLPAGGTAAVPDRLAGDRQRGRQARIRVDLACG